MKPIYIPKGKALEYADYALNIYNGCNHGCNYCYAKKMHDRWHPERPFEQVEQRPGLLEALDLQLQSGKYAGKLIHLCFSCDPYPAPPVDTSITREVIQLLKWHGCHVQILTKAGDRATRDFDLLDHNDWVGATMTFSSDAEPNAATSQDRLYMLREANEKHINTWVSMEPVLKPQLVMDFIQHYGFINRYWIGKLNYHPSDIDWGKFGLEVELLAFKLGRNLLIKHDLRAEIDAQ